MLDRQSNIFVVLNSDNEFVETYNLIEMTNLYFRDKSFREKIDNKSFKVYIQDDEKFLNLLVEEMKLVVLQGQMREISKAINEPEE